MYDMGGYLILYERVILSEESNDIRINSSNFKAGLNIVSLITNKEKLGRKIILY